MKIRNWELLRYALAELTELAKMEAPDLPQLEGLADQDQPTIFFENVIGRISNNVTFLKVAVDAYNK